MQSRLIVCLALVSAYFTHHSSLVMSASAATAPTTQPLSIKIDVAHPGHAISPDLYGIFFEEINHAGDGGIYAQFLENPSFEAPPPKGATNPVGWTFMSPDKSAKLETSTDNPFADTTPHHIRITAKGPATLTNDGYWGISLFQDHDYHLRFAARFEGTFEGKLQVNLTDADKVLDERVIEGLGSEWKTFDVKLTSPQTVSKAKFNVVIDGKGTVCLDAFHLVRLNEDGSEMFRSDLLGKLSDLSPAFMRFPGGCFVEGNVLANAFRWKTTLADPMHRPGHFNDNWHYQCTDGLGFHEYLMLCEKIGAAPMYVCNVGMAHKDNVPLDKLDEWIQDALDAIAYANAPDTTPMGKLRAKAGHPEPFNLKYIEIGNENGGKAYEERYPLFQKAIKERFPEIQTIANSRVKAPMEILDDHYYNSAAWFIANTHRYDNHDRKGPKIYVGEYAVTIGCGKGNLRAAIAEAAFMTGLERNSDIVVMSSYAPLFANLNDRRWTPDLICFDASASYATPSYYVQKLFSQNRPDVLLPTEISTGTTESIHGAIGVGTWNTQAEFKEIFVSHGDDPLFKSDFSKDAASFHPSKGEWKTQDSAFRQSAPGEDLRATAGNPEWSDYTYTLKARKISGKEGFLIMFAVRSDKEFYWWNIGGWDNTKHAIEKTSNGHKSIVGPQIKGEIETNRWYDIKIEMHGAHISCYLDGKLIHDFNDAGPTPLFAIAGKTNRGAIIVKVVNTHDEPQAAEITLEGATNIDPQAQATVLTSDSPEDENTLRQARKVAPEVQVIKDATTKINRTFPPHSLTVLRLRENQPTTAP